MVHWYRNVFTVVPKGKVKEVVAMLKAIHAQEDRQAAREKAQAVVEKLEAMQLGQAATIVAAGVRRDALLHGLPARALDAACARTTCWSGSCGRFAGGRAWWATSRMDRVR